MTPSWRVLKDIYREAPDLLQFPDSLSGYAAIGSRYWNIENPKIRQIVMGLKALAEVASKRGLGYEQSTIFSYLRGTAFQGYVVASRYSGANLALEVPNRLLTVARSTGLTDVEGLLPTDFLPGTTDGYQNPYHYDLSGWKKTGTGLGKRMKEI
jgi:hypothetical protein